MTPRRELLRHRVRGAARRPPYAVASGAYDIAMAVGVEKVKDGGYQGLAGHATRRTTAPAARSPRRRCSAWSPPRTRKKYGVERGGDARRARAHRVEEPLQRRPQPARPVPPRGEHRDDLRRRRKWPARSACSTARAWPTAPRPRSSCGPRTPHRYTDKPLYIKALSFVAGNGSGLADPDYDYTTFPEVVDSARGRVPPGRHHRPARASWRWPRCTTASRRPSSCSWRTSASPSGARRGRRSSPGTFDLDGDLPVNPDGGLKSFGHPVGASGLRMMFECWLQLRGEAPEERRLGNDRKLALTHNLGGYPGEMVSFVSIVGTEPRLLRSATRNATRPGKPLDGVRVLAAEQMQALPYATQLLARLGADVVKVEPPAGESGRGSQPVDARPRRPRRRRHVPAQQPRQAQRRHRPEVADAGASCSCASCPRFDVVAENFKAGTMDRLGLGYDDVAARASRGRSTCRCRASATSESPYERLAGVRVDRRGDVGHLRVHAPRPTSRRGPTRSARSATSAPRCSPPSACSPRCATATAPARASTSTSRCSTPTVAMTDIVTNLASLGQPSAAVPAAVHPRRRSAPPTAGS